MVFTFFFGGGDNDHTSHNCVCHRWIGVFKSDEERQKIMQWTKELYDMLNVFEPIRDLHPFIDQALTAALWPQSVFCRETIVGARETEFEGLAPMSTKTLICAARAFGVKPTEDLHRCLNVQARLNYNGNLSRDARWHTAWTCGVIEANDRKGPRIGEENRREAVQNKLNNKTYEVKSSEFSMGEEVFKDLLNTKETYLYRVQKVNTPTKCLITNIDFMRTF